MHAILHLQADRAVPEDHEAFKEGLGQPRAGGLLVHDDRPELLVVADEDDLLAPQHEGDHALWRQQ